MDTFTGHYFSYHIYFIIQCWNFSFRGWFCLCFIEIPLSPCFLLMESLKASITHLLHPKAGRLAALLQFGVYFSQRLLEVHDILCLLLKKCWNHKSMYGFIILLVEFYVLEGLCIRDLDSVRCKVEGFMTVKVWRVFLKLLLGVWYC